MLRPILCPFLAWSTALWVGLDCFLWPHTGHVRYTPREQKDKHQGEACKKEWLQYWWRIWSTRRHLKLNRLHCQLRMSFSDIITSVTTICLHSSSPYISTNLRKYYAKRNSFCHVSLLLMAGPFGRPERACLPNGKLFTSSAGLHTIQCAWPNSASAATDSRHLRLTLTPCWCLSVYVPLTTYSVRYDKGETVEVQSAK
jgi:hypothetical protein